MDSQRRIQMGERYKTSVTLVSVCGHQDDNGPSYIDLTVVGQDGHERILRWPFYSDNEDLAFRMELGKKLRVKGTKNPQVPWYDLDDFIFEDNWR
jgi:hypothetical protein